MEHAISFPALGLDFNINRVAVNLFGKDIYWYGIIICLGFVLAALYVNRRTKEFGVTSDNLMDCLIIGVPVGVLTSVFMARFCPEGLYKLLKPVVNLLAGIPSIVYGFFGLVVLVPFIREHFKNSNGQSILCASILLGIMILPTIIGASEPTIRAVEQSYYEGALALGATHERSVFTVVVPAAKSGILAAVILGVGRALGETMAVMMVVGNQPRVPNSILQGVRTLTTNIVMEMGYATDLHREALIATGVVLFAFILIINLCFSSIKRSGKE